MAVILRQYQGKLCSLLDSSSDTLESLTVELYSNYIIDESVKNNVLREKGYTGARILWDAAILKVRQSPGAKDDVFKAMETQGILKQLVTEMRIKEQSVIPPRYDDEEKMGTPSIGNTPSESIKMKSEQEVLEEANTLQDKFDHLLDEVGKHSLAIRNVSSLQLRLNRHLTRARENTAAVKDVLSNIDQMNEPSKILHCLIRCDLIGYMNYRLLDVFQKLIREPQLDQLVQDYEDALLQFLKSTDLGTLAQVFDSDSTVAPVTFAGLPQFTVHLNDSWEGKSVHRWDQLLKSQFNWSSHIQIVRISKKCIIITYSVFRFFAPDVVRDLTNSRILSLLEEQGITKIELTDHLIEIAKEEENFDDLLLEAAKHCSDTGIMESLLRRGANVNATSTEWQKLSPLHLSAMNGNCAAVRLLIEYGADIDKEDGYGRTPLHHAARKGKKEVVELLLKAGADIHKANEYWYTTLYDAVDGNIETLELLLNNGAIADINRKYRLQRSPLHHAAKKGHDEAVALLVKSGAILDEKDKYGNTPLHLATSYGMKTTVELLLSYNADYTIQNKYGQTILHCAVEAQDIEIVEVILKLCDASYLHKQVSSPNSCTPLYCAVSHGNGEIVELLLKFGANYNIGDESGRSPLVVAFEKSHERIIKLLLQAGADPSSVVYYEDDECTLLHYAVLKDDKSMVELLLKYGVNRNEKDSKGHTPLYIAVEMGLDRIADLLLQAGANLDAVDESGQHTLLHVAIAKVFGSRRAESLLHQAGTDHSTVDKNDQECHERVVELLLQAGADPKSAICEDGYTPLHLAAEKGQHKVMILLVKYGAIVDKKDVHGNTPLHLAASHGMETAVELLLSYNADYTIQNKDLMYTPLHCAVSHGSVEIVELLLKSGADHSIRDKRGFTPFHSLIIEKMDHGIKRFRNMVELFVKHRANINTKNKFGLTPLHNAVGAREEPHSTSTFPLGLTPHRVVGSQEEPHSTFSTLSEFREFRHYRGRFHSDSGIVRMLLSKGANVNEKDNDGHTPIYYATDEKIVQLLLQYGASKDEHQVVSSTESESSYGKLHPILPSHPPPLPLKHSSKQKVKSYSSLAKTKVKQEYTRTEIDPSSIFIEQSKDSDRSESES